MKPADTGGDSVAKAKAPAAKDSAGRKKSAKTAVEGEAAAELDPVVFRERLMAWYRAEARTLPWRGSTDPYQIWVSEIMLQQTRVAAVIEHYNEFLRRFPTLVSLALAGEADVLAAWSGLGYYRRARMLHKAAQFIVLERDASLPASSAELRTLPGIGDYTAAAIASIAFGEEVAVVDGNVERVILRLVGRADDATAAGRAFIREQAQTLMPHTLSGAVPADAAGNGPVKARGNWMWNASDRIALAAGVHPTEPVGGSETAARPANNPAGDHNQAMMELGATVCLPRTPLCGACPVYALCQTRGEHVTQPRAAQLSVPVAYLLDLRKRGTTTEVLLSLRNADASIMPAMFELPGLPLEAVEGREPVLRVRHAITNTNYYVQVFAQPNGPGKKTKPEQRLLRSAVPKDAGDMHWANVLRLPGLPITGLARKILQRLNVMESARMNVLE